MITHRLFSHQIPLYLLIALVRKDRIIHVKINLLNLRDRLIVNLIYRFSFRILVDVLS